MKKLLIAIIIFLASTGILHASCDWTGNIGSTSSLTVANINECITEASARTGEVTINLSAGTLAITSPFVVNMSSGFASVTSLNIIGAGTIPTGSTRGSAKSTNFTLSNATGLWQITTRSTKKVRISNQNVSGTASGGNAVITIYGNTNPSLGGGFRVDHMDLASTNPSTSYRSIWVTDAYGVIDHNTYTTNHMMNAIYMINGNTQWATPVKVGTSEMVYIEDNTATKVAGTWPNTMFCDGRNGARIVIRYNTVTNAYFGTHGFDGSDRSVAWYEVYNNTNILEANLFDFAGRLGEARINLRGGTGMYYNNTFSHTHDGVQQTHTGLYENSARFKYHRSDPSCSAASYPWCVDICDNTVVKMCTGTDVDRGVPCTTDADCDGESGACQNMDGNSDGTGYPCRDQSGVLNTHTEYTISNTYQLAHYPSLFWANTYNGNAIVPDVQYGTHIQNNRDYCYHATTMPATCNSIATTYSAYDYPHPLTGGGGDSDGTDPVLSAWFPTTEQVCSADPQSINLGITSVDANITTCKWDTSTAAYADLTNTFDGAAAGTVNHTDSASFACGNTHTIYYACSDDKGNVTDTASWTFSIPALLDETTPVITSVTSSTQAVALVQKLSVTTSVAGSCRYCVNGVGGCASDTAWASRTAFSVTGGETTHHEVSITQAASSSATYNVICQNTQGTATSTNSAITITTDAAKSITAGSGSLSITQGSGSLSVTILP